MSNLKSSQIFKVTKKVSHQLLNRQILYEYKELWNLLSEPDQHDRYIQITPATRGQRVPNRLLYQVYGKF